MIKNSIITGGDTWERRLDVMKEDLENGDWDYLFHKILITFVETYMANDYDAAVACKGMLSALNAGNELGVRKCIGVLEQLKLER